MTLLQKEIAVLHNKIASGEVARVEDLLHTSADAKKAVDTPHEETGYTALGWACVERVEFPLFRALLKVGPNVDVKGQDQETPLYFAVHNRLHEHVKALLEAGAHVNLENGRDKETALHCGAKFGFVNIVDTLLKKGADINSRNIRQETPLYGAAKLNRYEMVYFLLNNDANKTLGDRDGKNPLYVASEAGHKHCVALLKAEKKSLREVKAEHDVEIKMEPPKVAEPEEVARRIELRRSSAQQRADEEALLKARREKEKEDEQKRSEAHDVSIPKVRTHDPFTGKPLGPCRSLAEVGPTPPPSAPPGVKIPPAEYPPGGGTHMVVGTGTDAHIRQPPIIAEGDLTEDGPLVIHNPPITVGDKKPKEDKQE